MIASLQEQIKTLKERQDSTDAKIASIERIITNTNSVVAETQQALEATQTIMETNKVDVMTVLMQMQEANRLAQELATRQFAALQNTIRNQGTNGKENEQPHDPNAMKIDATTGGNQSNCDGRSPLGSSTMF